MAKFGKDYKEAASNVLQCTLASYYNWANQKRPIIALLEKYFTKEDLEEFVQTGKISKFEMLEEFQMILQGSKLDYLEFISKYLKYTPEFDFFTDFYYRFLVYVHTLQHNRKYPHIEFQNIFQLNDALPSFFISNSFAHLNESEAYRLQYKIRQINSMDQNLTNFILLNISDDFQSLTQKTIFKFSDEYRKQSIIHSLMFCIYKYHPNLDYEEKINLFGSVLRMDASIVFDHIQWKIIEVERTKVIEAIKAYK